MNGQPRKRSVDRRHSRRRNIEEAVMNAEPTMRSQRLRTALAGVALLYALLSLAVLATASTPMRGGKPNAATSLESQPLAR